MMKKVLIFTAIAEGLTGVALLVAPEFVIRVLSGADAAGLDIFGWPSDRHRTYRLGRGN